MLIGFVGIPCSGKTTLAAKLFSEYKQNAEVCELIVEQARQFIAKMKYDNKMSKNDKVALTDKDQGEIALQQYNLEKTIKYSSELSNLIISDSSAINAFLYTSKFNGVERGVLNQFKDHYDLLFYCYPVDLIESLPDDPNRIHNYQEILKLQERANHILKYLKDTGFNIHELYGTMNLEQRFKEVMYVVSHKLVEMAQRA